MNLETLKSTDSTPQMLNSAAKTLDLAQDPQWLWHHLGGEIAILATLKVKPTLGGHQTAKKKLPSELGTDAPQAGFGLPLARFLWAVPAYAAGFHIQQSSGAQHATKIAGAGPASVGIHRHVLRKQSGFGFPLARFLWAVPAYAAGFHIQQSSEAQHATKIAGAGPASVGIHRHVLRKQAGFGFPLARFLRVVPAYAAGFHIQQSSGAQHATKIAGAGPASVGIHRHVLRKQAGFGFPLARFLRVVPAYAAGFHIQQSSGAQHATKIAGAGPASVGIHRHVLRKQSGFGFPLARFLWAVPAYAAGFHIQRYSEAQHATKIAGAGPASVGIHRHVLRKQAGFGFPLARFLWAVPAYAAGFHIQQSSEAQHATKIPGVRHGEIIRSGWFLRAVPAYAAGFHIQQSSEAQHATKIAGAGPASVGIHRHVLRKQSGFGFPLARFLWAVPAYAAGFHIQRYSEAQHATKIAGAGPASVGIHRHVLRKQAGFGFPLARFRWAVPAYAAGFHIQQSSEAQHATKIPGVRHGEIIRSGWFLRAVPAYAAGFHIQQSSEAQHATKIAGAGPASVGIHRHVLQKQSGFGFPLARFLWAVPAYAAGFHIQQSSEAQHATKIPGAGPASVGIHRHVLRKQSGFGFPLARFLWAIPAYAAGFHIQQSSGAQHATKIPGAGPASVGIHRHVLRKQSGFGFPLARFLWAVPAYAAGFHIQQSSEAQHATKIPGAGPASVGIHRHVLRKQSGYGFALARFLRAVPAYAAGFHIQQSSEAQHATKIRGVRHGEIIRLKLVTPHASTSDIPEHARFLRAVPAYAAGFHIQQSSEAQHATKIPGAGPASVGIHRHVLRKQAGFGFPLASTARHKNPGGRTWRNHSVGLTSLSMVTQFHAAPRTSREIIRSGWLFWVKQSRYGFALARFLRAVPAYAAGFHIQQSSEAQHATNIPGAGPASVGIHRHVLRKQSGFGFPLARFLWAVPAYAAGFHIQQSSEAQHATKIPGVGHGEIIRSGWFLRAVPAYAAGFHIQQSSEAQHATKIAGAGPASVGIHRHVLRKQAGFGFPLARFLRVVPAYAAGFHIQQSSGAQHATKIPGAGPASVGIHRHVLRKQAGFGFPLARFLWAVPAYAAGFHIQQSSEAQHATKIPGVRHGEIIRSGWFLRAVPAYAAGFHIQQSSEAQHATKIAGAGPASVGIHRHVLRKQAGFGFPLARFLRVVPAYAAGFHIQQSSGAQHATKIAGAGPASVGIHRHVLRKQSGFGFPLARFLWAVPAYAAGFHIQQSSGAQHATKIAGAGPASVGIHRHVLRKQSGFGFPRASTARHKNPGAGPASVGIHRHVLRKQSGFGFPLARFLRAVPAYAAGFHIQQSSGAQHATKIPGAGPASVGIHRHVLRKQSGFGFPLARFLWAIPAYAAGFHIQQSSGAQHATKIPGAGPASVGIHRHVLRKQSGFGFPLARFLWAVPAYAAGFHIQQSSEAQHATKIPGAGPASVGIHRHVLRKQSGFGFPLARFLCAVPAYAAGFHIQRYSEAQHATKIAGAGPASVGIHRHVLRKQSGFGFPLARFLWAIPAYAAGFHIQQSSGAQHATKIPGAGPASVGIHRHVLRKQSGYGFALARFLRAVPAYAAGFHIQQSSEAKHATNIPGAGPASVGIHRHVLRKQSGFGFPLARFLWAVPAYAAGFHIQQSSEAQHATKIPGVGHGEIIRSGW
ncbi:hypothetical protein C8R43DRAFT_942542 [Mycena crocata]|nr:hypothetical protein C8R43DRAFT_942542 [Mycena crocata]